MLRKLYYLFNIPIQEITIIYLKDLQLTNIICNITHLKLRHGLNTEIMDTLNMDLAYSYLMKSIYFYTIIEMTECIGKIYF